jgi:hypothetical protein
MESLPIVRKLMNMNDVDRHRILCHQGMEGYFERFYPELVSSKGIFKQQQQRNLIHEEESLKLAGLLRSEGLESVFVKGITFLHDLYPELGTRFMSDVDCYISHLDYEKLDNILAGKGFRPISDKRWLGNEHKREYLKKTDLGDVCFEFHNKLFWHREDPYVTFEDRPLRTLGREEVFVYLCGHYAFLHSCQKLYWLWDIYLFIKKYGDSLDIDRVRDLCSYFGFNRSVRFITKLMKDAFGLDFHFDLKNSYIPVRHETYFCDDQRSWYYMLLKFSLKDEWKDQVRYNKSFFMK